MNYLLIAKRKGKVVLQAEVIGKTLAAVDNKIKRWNNQLRLNKCDRIEIYTFRSTKRRNYRKYDTRFFYPPSESILKKIFRLLGF